MDAREMDARDKASEVIATRMLCRYAGFNTLNT
jgi:vancomycin permeability regulator SanA